VIRVVSPASVRIVENRKERFVPDRNEIRPVSRCDWEDLSHRFLDHSYQQSWVYAHALAKRRHCECEHVAIDVDGELIGLASVRVKQLPVVGGGIAYVASGPLTRLGRDDDIDRLAQCLTVLEAEYVQRRGFTLRILAPVGSPSWNSCASESFKRTNFVPTDRSRSYRTFLLDIDRSLDDLRAGFSKYWRRNLRRAQQRDFVIRTGTTSDFFSEVGVLYQRLRGRKKFHVDLDADFYASLQSQLSDEERFEALIVEHDHRPVAGLVLSMLGDTCVPLVLAADEAGLRNYAVYDLQWHSIVMAHERRLSYYDLGGIDAESNAGVYNFKKGMRGSEICAPGPFESSPSGVIASITNSAERIYRRFARAA